MSEGGRIRAGALIWVGLVVLGAAALWWGAVFGVAVWSGYGGLGDAAPCLWGSDAICALILSVCSAQHPLIPRIYYPELFWAGVALLVAGGMIVLRNRLR